jgi:hypothetical protein
LRMSGGWPIFGSQAASAPPAHALSAMTALANPARIESCFLLMATSLGSDAE